MTNQARPFTNPEAELRVIGSALIDPEAIGKLTTLRADDFANMAHRNIWDALVDLGPLADWATVKTWLDRRAILADVEALTGPIESYIASATGTIPTALNIEAYAADVVDMARRRELNNALSAAATANETSAFFIDIPLWFWLMTNPCHSHDEWTRTRQPGVNR